ncbi:MAG: acetyl-CoA acetyltransferase [Pseudomonadota bacterium]
MTQSLRAKAACIGLATTGSPEAPGRNSVELMAEASLAALADAGLSLADVDGLFAANATQSMAAVSLAEYLGIRPVFSDGSNIGGSSFLAHALTAAMALEAGLINVALIAYGSNQRTAGGFRSISEPMVHEAPFEPRMPITAYALAASRYCHEFGATPEDFAEVAVAARQWAALNPQAMHRDLLTVADVQAARMVSDPFTIRHCCLVTDGGAAIVLTRADRAKDAPRPPVYLLGAGMAHWHRMISTMPDFTLTAASESGPRALEMARYGVSDMTTVQLYDAFTINTVLFLEDLGVCPKGEGWRFVKDGRIAPDGECAVNSNGGGLSAVHPGMYGLYVTIEALRQARHAAGYTEYEREPGGWVDSAHLNLAHGNGGVLSTQVTTVWGTEQTI